MMDTTAKKMLKNNPYLKRSRKLKVEKWMPYEDKIQLYYFEQLQRWIDDPRRKPPIFAFTSGLGRFMAELCTRYAEVERQHARLPPPDKSVGILGVS